MPIVIPDNLPAVEVLQTERVFVMKETRAIHQDIRALKVLILNIMPLKIQTETHLLRQLANTPLQIEIQLLHTKTYLSKNTPEDHLNEFYKTFDDIKDQKFDGLIITGAPVEQIDFEEVVYWEEMKHIMDWAKTNVTAKLYICWAAQAGLYHYYGVPKYPLPKKMFGVFEHNVNVPTLPIVRGFDEVFFAPHSRHTEIQRDDILKVPQLQIVSESDEAGVYIVANEEFAEIFVTGHSEYEAQTLNGEYRRDVAKGLEIDIPRNYFKNNNPENEPVVRWKSHASLLYANWINYYVYQRTPFNINEIGK